jgi:hypothetical protein
MIILSPPLPGISPAKTVEVVSKPSIGFEIKEGEEAQPEEYMVIFRGLRFKPDGYQVAF